MKNWTVTAITILPLLLSDPAPSWAQSTPSPTPTAAPAKSSAPKEDTSAEARERFNQGVALAKKNDWRRAYSAFLDAWKLKEHPQVALNLGRAELEIGKYRDAIEHLDHCLANTPAEDPDFALARDFRAEAEKKAAKLTVTVDVPGARITVDEQFVGRSPLASPVLLDAGSHVVEARRNEQRARRGVILESGATLTVTLILGVSPAAEASTTPSATPSTTPTAEPPVSAEKPSSVRTGLLIGGVTGSLLGIAIGATAAGLSFVKEAERDQCVPGGDDIGVSEYNSARACWDEREDQRLTLAGVSLAGFLAGGLFALGTGAYWLFGAKPAEPSVALAPLVTNTSGGLVVTGHW